jgi:hypothetical protein
VCVCVCVCVPKVAREHEAHLLSVKILGEFLEKVRFHDLLGVFCTTPPNKYISLGAVGVVSSSLDQLGTRVHDFLGILCAHKSSGSTPHSSTSQHTSAYVSIRQHTWQHTSAYVSNHVLVLVSCLDWWRVATSLDYRLTRGA